MGWEESPSPPKELRPVSGAGTQDGPADDDLAKDEHEREMLQLARRMKPIPYDDRRALTGQFQSSVDLYLKAKGLAKPEKSKDTKHE